MAKTKKELVWNVFYEDNGKITERNIFRGYFIEKLNDLYKEYKKALKSHTEETLKDNYVDIDNWRDSVKDYYMEKVKNYLMYCYWGRCECEIILTSWPTAITEDQFNKLVQEKSERDAKNIPTYNFVTDLATERKTDMYEQVMINWDIFTEYLWNNWDCIDYTYKQACKKYE